MVGGSIEIWMKRKSNLFCFSEDRPNSFEHLLASESEFEPNVLHSSLLTTSKNAPKPYRTWKVLHAKQQPANQKSRWVKSYPFNSMGVSVGSWSPVIFHMLFCVLNQYFLSTCGACGEAVFNFEWRATYSGSLKAKLMAKLILAPLECFAKWVWPSMNWCRMFFVQTCTLPPTMHWSKNYRTWMGLVMQNNKVQTKSHVELEDNSTMLMEFCLH